ncbi:MULTISPECIES: AEC family transporter [Halomonadaceae]|uniref:AEC family transporter n=1 Tax=Halomonadaceae TaxID=28256 RepID=UPI00159B0C71|nr:MULTISPECIES: AEC family transporter [Halomonas]QJQ95338.1 AEC family transporter [Halomonas sp. PA5]
MNLIEVFLGTLEVTLPVFAMVFIGIALKRAGWIDQAFIATASSLVFRATMPTLIFLSIIKADLSVAFNPRLLGFFTLATLMTFFMAWCWAAWRVPYEDRGVYVQGSFRGNGGIVGLALAASMYGTAGLSAAGLLIGVVILSYNVLSVIVLSAYQPGQRTNWRSIIAHIVHNPLILSVLVALPLALLSITLPGWVMTSGEYFASLTLPLALICIGATLSISALRNDNGSAMSASLMKMVFLPLAATALAWLVGFSGPELGLLFLFFASPSAAASFVMVKAMGGNAKLAANIIAISTLMASVTVTAGVFLLQVLSLI